MRYLKGNSEKSGDLSTVLILTKDAMSRGGVAGYYNLFFEKVQDNEFRFERFVIGSRSKDYYRRERRYLGYSFTYLTDIFRFTWQLMLRKKVKHIQLSPSLIPVPLIRDGIFLLLAKLFGKKVVVYIRGWRDDVSRKICDRTLLNSVFLAVYNRADRLIVLSEDFQNQLVKIGVAEGKIVVSKTMFDGNLIQQRPVAGSQNLLFLFLSRISIKKGAFDIIEAAGRLKNAGMKFKIVFHGHGDNLNTIGMLMDRAATLKVSDFIEVGKYIEGIEKYTSYAEADVFLLPSYHEGCPNSILEAMGSGCYVICTDAGAMKEVVIDGVNGAITEVGNVEDLAEKMKWAIENTSCIREIGGANRRYAFKRFEAQAMIKQIVSVHRSILEQN